jgi:hypothetical protein
MNKLIQFLCIFFGFWFISPAIAKNKTFTLASERRLLNRKLARGERVLFISVEHFYILCNELSMAGWMVYPALLEYNSKLRGVTVKG